MLGKLSIRNAKRQAKDYIIYFITVAISVALMFSFHSIAVSNDISDLSKYLKDFSKYITGISVVIILIMAWLINYTMKFMLEKRSKEFGTYQILGLEKKDIANIFTLENMVIGILAFVIGIGLGVFLYQILTSIIMNLFNQPYQIGITFSLEAVGKTAIFFFITFILVLWNCRRKIKKTKVYDLLYADKKNENNIIKNTKGNAIIFILSLILMIGALFIANGEVDKINASEKADYIVTAIIMLILSIFLFYKGITSFLVKRYLGNKSRKYKKNHMFLYRNLTSKINTMTITISIIALMFTLIFVGGNVALLYNNMLNNEIEMSYPFEILLGSDSKDFTKYKEYIEKNAQVKNMYEYRIYYINSTGIAETLADTNFRGAASLGYDYVLSLTDYNKLREMLGADKIELQDDEIIVNTLKTVKRNVEEYTNKNDTLQIANRNMKIKGIEDESIGQIWFNGYYYTIIVPDNLIEDISREDEILRSENEGLAYNGYIYKLVVETEETTSEEFYEGLYDCIDKENIEVTEEINGRETTHTVELLKGSLQTKGSRTSQSRSLYTIISFLAFYLALIFVMATATLLAIQQLSDSEKYKYRYDLLQKLGMDKKDINKMILKQLLFYFAIPMIIPIFIGIPITLIVSKTVLSAITIEEVIRNIGIILGIFILVYGIYFIATYIQFNRNIEEKR